MSDERKFLHDLASPITVVSMNLEFAQALILENQSGDQSKLLELLAVCIRNIDKAGNLIVARREVLKKTSGPN